MDAICSDWTLLWLVSVGVELMIVSFIIRYIKQEATIWTVLLLIIAVIFVWAGVIWGVNKAYVNVDRLIIQPKQEQIRK